MSPHTPILTFSPADGPTWHSGSERLHHKQLMAKLLDLKLSAPAVSIVPDIVRGIQRQGHGGMLVVLPGSAGIDEDRSLTVKPDFRFDPPMVLLRDAMAMLEQVQALIPPAPELIAAAAGDVTGHMEFVAGLAGADGAVVIDSSLVVRAFGVFLERGDERSVSEANRIDPTTLEATRAQVPGGTRHRSAAAWCANRGASAGAGDEAVVFTVSEDGVASAFVPISDYPFVSYLRPLDLG